MIMTNVDWAKLNGIVHAEASSALENDYTPDAWDIAENLDEYTEEQVERSIKSLEEQRLLETRYEPSLNGYVVSKVYPLGENN